jgi:hypothetical protein
LRWIRDQNGDTDQFFAAFAAFIGYQYAGGWCCNHAGATAPGARRKAREK